MSQIQIKKAIEERGLDLKEVAKHLFPENKHPLAALERVVEGKALLNSEQVSKLASLVGMSISELYGNNWKIRSRGGITFLVKDNYRVELDQKTWTTRIFDNNSLFHESVIHSGFTPLSVYLEAISQIISGRSKV